MNSIEQLKADNAEFLWHPMAHPAAMKKTKPDIVARGEGCWIWDVDGHKLLDGVGGLWASNLGHSATAVRDAIVAQLDELPFYNTFRGTSHPRAIELSARLVKLMEPDGVASVMFSSGGSDAVETALKLARQYHKLRGEKDRFKFISLRQGYHGVHFGGMSVNGNTNFRRAYEPLLPGCFHIDTPWLYRNPYTDDPLELGEICAELLEREIVFQGPDTVAAFIAEPVQGAGGVIVPPANYWPLVRKICDKHGVLLIADEVVTGFGRTGHLFGTRLWGVNADLWCLAKGISSGYVPLGATAISAKVAKVFDDDKTGQAAVGHGYTYSAHPVGAAAALATLDEIQRLDVPGNAGRVGAVMQERLRKLEQTCSFVGNVRGVGLMLGIEMVDDKALRTPMPRSSDIPARVAKEAYRRGLMVRISGPNLILSPPLVISADEVNHLCDVLEASFAAVEATL
ncbi:aminotransferase class III-fold pyridoxal phosphate-dependent enzyme [Hydrogenophaga taeniospiralis]|uniref:aminotransferase class III-fold pyridoxal phosphate-dependent enzyme n=1 Tax=Hydrogenophaga taeniospiralis TaxID=65656 RepID=UPI001CF991CD|nr:aminotransferase class III-fold pyridoxal phosphate-dependent enzyme [Hydrogenophaga taeniospiralis]MCB4364183.1 aminotransferase class III-fold pyridoxal phosphate-dependent enzyme [Hydrogenophaga taeniospiralis]